MNCLRINFNDVSSREPERVFLTRKDSSKLTKLQNLASKIIGEFKPERVFSLKTFKEVGFGATSFISMFCASVFAHECSHMVAMRILFTNINPYLGCDFSKMMCYADWNGSPLIRPELPITFETGHGIVNAAGPISDMLLVALSSIAAWKMRDSNKKISLLFAVNACAIGLNTFSYAANTQGTGEGDFAAVESSLGISHNIQTAITGGVALSAYMLMNYLIAANVFRKLKKCFDV